jgi:hypothetical protein
VLPLGIGTTDDARALPRIIPDAYWSVKIVRRRNAFSDRYLDTSSRRAIEHCDPFNECQRHQYASPSDLAFKVCGLSIGLAHRWPLRSNGAKCSPLAAPFTAPAETAGHTRPDWDSPACAGDIGSLDSGEGRSAGSLKNLSVSSRM